jgi:PKD repeat protein
MKKLSAILTILTVFFGQLKAQTPPVCCPEVFEIKTLIGTDSLCQARCDNSFVPTTSDPAGTPPSPANGQVKQSMVACKNSSFQYLVTPNLPGFTYTWTVTGGTVTPNPGNPVTITWGNTNTGSITVDIVSANCVRRISYDVCLLDKPLANFNISPAGPYCVNNLLQFNNTSIGGGQYLWNFGDGQTSTQQNPQHQYTATGTYTVTLIVKSGTSNSCACVDSIKQTIKIEDGPGIEGCDKMLCPGDTATYCSTKTCSSYSWSVSGGTIIGAANQKCVKVVWSSTQPGTLPATITLNTAGCGSCPTTTMPVNIVWPNLPIQGPTIVCVGSTETYSLPVLPGTFYTWTLSGGGVIVSGGAYPAGFPVNNPQINVNWFTAGTYTLTVNYINPNTPQKCGGTSTLSILVKPKFTISGNNNPCQGLPPSTYTTGDGSQANWTITGGVFGTNYVVAGGLPALNNAAGITVQWLTPGTYQLCAAPIAANLPNYCNNSVCAAIVVKPRPVLTVTGPTPACANTLTTYTATVNPAANVNWVVTPAGSTVAPYGTNNTNASILFSGAGPWTVGVQANLNGCTGNASMLVNPVPPPTLPAGPLTACIGGQVNVTAGGTGPFTWGTTPAATLVSSSGNTATYEIHGSGSISVSNCAGSATISVNATLPTPVSIVPSGNLCPGMTLTATAGFTSYSWSGPGGFSSAVNPATGATLPGTYTVLATSASGCVSMGQVTIPPQSLPTITISTGSPLVYCLPAVPNVVMNAVYTSGCGTVQWFLNGSPVGSGVSFTGVLPGTYTATVTCNGCTVTSNPIVVSQGPCGGGGPGCTAPNPLSPITVTGCNPKTFSVNITDPSCTGTINWSFGDGGSASGSPVTHTYSNIGSYPVLAGVTCNGCSFVVYTSVDVPVIANFNYSIQCGVNGANTITFNNTSQILGGWNVTSVNWTSSCGAPASGSGNSYILNTPGGCSPTVTMVITLTNLATGQVCTDTRSQVFNFPTTPLTINGCVPKVCKDQTYAFSSSMVGALYQWTVNGTPVSQNPTLNYSFNGVPANPVIGLTVTDINGCTFTATCSTTVVTPPALSITPAPIVKVCDGPCPTNAMLTATPGFVNYQWFQNGVSLGAPSPSNTYTVTGPNPIGTYYVQAQSTPDNCAMKSNTTTVIYHPKPLAQIQAQTTNCVPSFPFTLSNVSTPNIQCLPFTAGHQYDWYLNTTGGAPIFTSTTSNFLNYTIPAAGTYSFIVKVTDPATGCCAIDTACVLFSRNPTVSIAPGGPLCQGPVYALTATAAPAGTYIYTWQNGQQGPTHSAWAAGIYSVQAMDNIGCSGSASITIKPLPYVDLFPQGCDTICKGDTSHLWFPLPYTSWGAPGYTISWFDNGNPVAVPPPGIAFPLSGLALGNHVITATVVMNGCTINTAAYNVYVKNCEKCDCEGSYWKDGPWWVNETTGEQQKIECKSDYTYVITGEQCKDQFSITGTYICKGDNCPGKVTYELYDANTNILVTSGSGTLSIPVGLPNGSYYVNIYAWCGDNKCDSCTIRIRKDCDMGCDCNKPGVHLQPVLTINKAIKEIKCGGKFVVNCNNTVSLNASYWCVPQNCPAVIQYQLTGPISQTGTLPLTLNSLPPGNYTIVLMAYCGGKLCDECKLQFTVECEKVCCPYEIGVSLGSQSTSVEPTTGHLLASQAFNFTGLTGANITEVRADVLSYTLSSQYPEACIGCKNLPRGWAGIYNGSVMGTVIPKVNVAGVPTTAPLNVSTMSPYGNPREIVWSNGGAVFSVVQPITLGFVLPKPSPLDCCEVMAEICVKFTFRDDKCRECEVIQCFKVPVKKTK